MVLNVGRDQPGFKIRILKPGIVTFWKVFGLGWKNTRGPSKTDVSVNFVNCRFQVSRKFIF